LARRSAFPLPSPLLRMQDVSERRALDYNRVDAIMTDVERLLAGHKTVGNWTLGQILDHLARSIRLTLRPLRVESPPAPSTPEQDAARQAFFQNRSIPSGREIPTPRIVPDPNADPFASAEALRTVLEHLIMHESPFPSHPLLGPLNHDEWIHFHCIHCAHHLSFAAPT
jgi:hypothetical protein